MTLEERMNYYKSCYGDKTAPKSAKSVQEAKKKSTEAPVAKTPVAEKTVKEEKKGFFKRIKEKLFGKK